MVRTRDWSDEPIVRRREDVEPATYPLRPPIALWVLAGVLALVWRGRDRLVERYRAGRRPGAARPER